MTKRRTAIVFAALAVQVHGFGTTQAEEAAVADSDKGKTVINQNVTSTNQSGGITAHTVNQAPPPELRQLSHKLDTSPDGTFITSVLVEIVAPYPPASLSLEAHAPSVLDMQVMPQRTGIAMFGPTGKRDGLCFTSIHNPAGRYLITVRTSTREGVKIGYNFD
jgi:hypothetical protein